jgi:hypothetical protein
VNRSGWRAGGWRLVVGAWWVGGCGAARVPVGDGGGCRSDGGKLNIVRIRRTRCNHLSGASHLVHPRTLACTTRSREARMTMLSVPDHTEAAEYYFLYINQVAGTDIGRILETQGPETVALLEGISEERSRHRYAPGKWSIRQVLSHINDAERLFVFRAFWFARGLEEPLPSFEQDIAIAHAGADDRLWSAHIDEFRTVRAATVSLFRHLPPDAWMRRGTASGNPFSVRALAFITAGHVAHHVRLLRERYL